MTQSMQRKAPTQQRSRERVERMLTEATSLIAAQGSDALRMSDVAHRAGVSIGSLYQYFPDKAAIIRALAERYNEQGRVCVGDALSAVHDEAALSSAMLFILDTYYAMFKAEPVMRDIWSGTQSDKALQAMDADDGRWHGARLTQTVMQLRPMADRQKVAASSFLLMMLLCATVRTATALGGEEGDALVAAFKPMLLRELAAL